MSHPSCQESVPDLSVYESLDEMVQQLVNRHLYPEIQRPLNELYLETERVIACVDKLSQFIALLEDGDTAQLLGQTWTRDRTGQLLYLQTGCEDLVSVATVILPRNALTLMKQLLD